MGNKKQTFSFLKALRVTRSVIQISPSGVQIDRTRAGKQRDELEAYNGTETAPEAGVELVWCKQSVSRNIFHDAKVDVSITKKESLARDGWPSIIPW